MRTSAVLRGLPPLPPRTDWAKKFPLTTFNIVNRLSSYGGNKSGKRTNVIDPILAEEIVDSLDLKKGTHVVEAYPGMGGLTRAFLKQPEHTVAKLTAIEPASAFRRYGLGSEEPEEHIDKEERIGKAWKQLTNQQRGSTQKPSDPISYIADQSTQIESEQSSATEDDEDVEGLLGHSSGSSHTPVIPTNDKKAHSLLEQLKSVAVDPSRTPADCDPIQPNSTAAKQSISTDRPPDMLTIWSSSYENRLKVVDDTIYDWATFSKLDQMNVFEDVKAKSWEQEPPNIRFVAQIPESDLGEQLVAQWIGCMANQSWFFKYGRVQLSLIMRPTLFDRLTAVPGTKAYCKLSVMRAALCDYTPATSSYLDINLEDTMSEVQLLRLQRLDREKLKPRALALVGTSASGAGKMKVKGTSFGKSKFTEILSRYPDFGPLPARSSRSSSAVDSLLDREQQDSLSDSYYPKLKRTKREEGRPGMMALTLQPKKQPWIDKHSKDVWDYVLRRMFVMQGSTLEVAIKNLGLGAANLLPHLTGDQLGRQQKVDPAKLVREFDLQDWSNIVRAFRNWKFAPDVLLLGSVTQAEEGSSRMLGSGM